MYRTLGPTAFARKRLGSPKQVAKELNRSFPLTQLTSLGYRGRQCGFHAKHQSTKVSSINLRKRRPTGLARGVLIFLKRRSKHGLSTEQFPVSAYVGSSKNLKDLKDRPSSTGVPRYPCRGDLQAGGGITPGTRSYGTTGVPRS